MGKRIRPVTGRRLGRPHAAQRLAAGLCGILLASLASAESILAALEGVERDLNARAGFYLHDWQTGATFAYHADTRFPLNSTFKLFACGALLARVEAGEARIDTLVDLQGVVKIPWSPGVDEALAAGQSRVPLGDLCQMMLSVSDNTAANLVLAEIGGPQGFTAFMRSLGDETTRLDRWEPALNEGRPSDPRDTTTPRAIVGSLEALLLRDALSPDSVVVLRDWLAGHRVAGDLFRAVLPADWSIEDRTGAGGYGTRGIVAMLYPPERAPISVAMYLRDAEGNLDRRNQAVARVGQAIVDAVRGELVRPIEESP